MSNQSCDFKGKNLNASYSILTYDKLKYENDWESIPHAHPYCEILIVIKGHGYFANGNKKSHIKQGDVVITNRFIQHTEYPYEDTPNKNVNLEYVVFSLRDICFYPGNNKSFITEESLIFNMNSIWDVMKKLLYYLDKEIELKQAFWEISCKSIIDELIIQIMRKAQLNNFYSDNEQPARKIASLIEITKNYMERHYSDKITIEELAQNVFLNKFYLTHSFKKIEGISPFQFLMNVRIKKAQDLLRTTDFSITEIAMQTGFTSAANFCKQFKSITGISPMQYKRSD